MIAFPLWLLRTANIVAYLFFFISAVSALRFPAYTHPVERSREQIAASTDDNTEFDSVIGPVITTNFPDPAIIYDNGVSYAFATRNKNAPVNERHHVQVATSVDNVTWTLQKGFDPMPSFGAWETGASVWAPDVVKLSNGKYVLYYADTLKTATNKHCISAAISSSITGPYEPLDTALICPDPNTLGGAIDPEGFLDTATGKRYIIYKVDGNSLGHGGLCSNSVAPIVPTPLMLQEVDSEDGVTLIGEPVEMIRQDAHNGPLIEAPAMHRSSEGIYFLFYSSNCFMTPGYDVEYATATSITGPWQRDDTKLLHSGDGPKLSGPGGLDIIADGEMVVFHGILNMRNSKDYYRKMKDEARRKKMLINDIATAAPLVRGLYIAKATFKGRKVTLE